LAEEGAGALTSDAAGAVHHDILAAELNGSGGVLKGGDKGEWKADGERNTHKTVPKKIAAAAAAVVVV
jgi:hypothetical protein